MSKRFTTINSLEEIPQFATEDEEVEFWDSHEFSRELLREMRSASEFQSLIRSPRSRPVAIRFDESVLNRLRRLAELRGKGYQTLLKEFVVERLYEEEKREGLVGARGR